MMSQKCHVVACHHPAGGIAAQVNAADVHSAVGRTTAWAARSCDGGGIRFHSCFLAKLLQPTTRIATSDNVTRRISRRHTLPAECGPKPLAVVEHEATGPETRSAENVRRKRGVTVRVSGDFSLFALLFLGIIVSDLFVHTLNEFFHIIVNGQRRESRSTVITKRMLCYRCWGMQTVLYMLLKTSNLLNYSSLKSIQLDLLDYLRKKLIECCLKKSTVSLPITSGFNTGFSYCSFVD